MYRGESVTAHHYVMVAERRPERCLPFRFRRAHDRLIRGALTLLSCHHDNVMFAWREQAGHVFGRRRVFSVHIPSAAHDPEISRGANGPENLLVRASREIIHQTLRVVRVDRTQSGGGHSGGGGGSWTLAEPSSAGPRRGQRPRPPRATAPSRPPAFRPVPVPRPRRAAPGAPGSVPAGTSIISIGANCRNRNQYLAA